MKMFKFHLPIVGFGADPDEALECAWERLLADPNETFGGRELEYEELAPREHAENALAHTLTPFRGHENGLV